MSVRELMQQMEGKRQALAKVSKADTAPAPDLLQSGTMHSDLEKRMEASMTELLLNVFLRDYGLNASVLNEAFLEEVEPKWKEAMTEGYPKYYKYLPKSYRHFLPRPEKIGIKVEPDFADTPQTEIERADVHWKLRQELKKVDFFYPQFSELSPKIPDPPTLEEARKINREKDEAKAKAEAEAKKVYTVTSTDVTNAISSSVMQRLKGTGDSPTPADDAGQTSARSIALGAAAAAAAGGAAYSAYKSETGQQLKRDAVDSVTPVAKFAQGSATRIAKYGAGDTLSTLGSAAVLGGGLAAASAAGALPQAAAIAADAAGKVGPNGTYVDVVASMASSGLATGIAAMSGQGDSIRRMGDESLKKNFGVGFNLGRVVEGSADMSVLKKDDYNPRALLKGFIRMSNAAAKAVDKWNSALDVSAKKLEPFIRKDGKYVPVTLEELGAKR